MKGPVAPKDPVEKRSCLYVVLDKTISGRRGLDGTCKDFIFLEGRLIEQVKITSGDIDTNILTMLASVKEFRKLVHSVGVTMRAEDEEVRAQSAVFQLHCYGKTDKYTSGTLMEMSIPLNGEEYVMPVDGYPVNEEDTIIGAFILTMPEENKNAVLTVKFYLDDGYTVPEIPVDPPVQFDTPAYRRMIANSLLSTGNNYRLKSVIERTKKGEDITIAYLGGSITQGAGAKPINTMCYAYRSYEQFCKLFSPCDGKNVHYIKAGVGGTPSELGMLRYEHDVTDDGKVLPDLVVIEFAVNDNGDETKGKCFESLVLKVLEAPNHPAVLLLFMVFMNDDNLQERLIPIGERYQLPMISIKKAVTPQFYKDTLITKRQYFYDIFHPSNDGHRIDADCMEYLFRTVDQEAMAESDASLDVVQVYGTQFKNVICIDRKNISEYAEYEQQGFDGVDKEAQMVERNMDLHLTPEFENNWMHEAGNAYFKLKAACRNLLLIMKDSGDSKFGKADVYVDGVLTKTLDSLVIGWTHCNAIILVDEEEVKMHEIRIQMHPGDEEKKFTILGFGITR